MTMWYVINLTKGYVSHQDKVERGCLEYIYNAGSFTNDRFVIAKGAKERDDILKHDVNH